MTNHSAGDTVNPTPKSTKPNTTIGEQSAVSQSLQPSRKRRRLEPLLASAEIPEKAQRREEKLRDTCNATIQPSVPGQRNEDNKAPGRPEEEASERGTRSPTERLEEAEAHEVQAGRRKKQEQTNAPGAHQEASRRPAVSRDEARLRKTIQWLEEGARRLREDLANARTELHEERRAGKIAKRELDTAIREARAAETAKYQLIITELKSRLSRSMPADAACLPNQPSSAAMRMEFMREEHHKREISALKKRLAEAEATIRRLKWDSLNSQTKFSCKASGASCTEVRRLEAEVRTLRTSNEKLEEKLRIALEAEKARTNELRIQHENHEAELSSLRKSLRTETIKMMDELRGKSREIEKLSKLARLDTSRKRRKCTTKDEATMRKLRESERNGPIRSASRAEKKFITEDGHMVDECIREVGCDRAITEVEVERLRELALEQQEVIEILRQAVKEKERKLEQLSNKRRKEEFYRQWLELEPVAEVEDEEDHEEGDSALSSAPSSLSPQPGGCGQWQGNGVTREAYEAVLIEIEELQSNLLSERQELATAKTQVRDLEKALLQETRCASRNKEITALNEKLQASEEREATLLVELSELREQNELLEFRLLELEETSARRGSPDQTADSGIVSPEPIHANKDQSNKHRSRAVATVIPYTNSTSLNPRAVSPVPRKPPLSLQESGIFEEEDEEEDELEVELASRGTQTETPAGELLQEVQRLQELRARIQERAGKVTPPVICPVDQTKANLEAETENESVDSIVQLSTYQERIRELQGRLEAYEVEEEKRVQEKRLSKQREEELLDENYRLTERVYWLENELRTAEEQTNREEVKNGRENEADNSKGIGAGDGETPMEVEAALEKTDDKDELLDYPRITRDATVQVGYNDSEEPATAGICAGVSCGTKAVQTTEEISRDSTVDCLACRNRRTRREEENSARCSTSGMPPQSVVTVEEIAKEAREGEIDEVDTGRGNRSRANRISQVRVVPEEERARTEEPVVSFNESESDKKVRERRSIFREKDGWAMRIWGPNGIDNVSREVLLEKQSCRFVLSKEICV